MSTIEATPSSSRATPGLTPPTRKGRSTNRLGEVVIDLGLATSEQVDSALRLAGDRNLKIGEAMIEAGILDENGLARALAERLGLDHVDLSVFKQDPTVAGLLPTSAARRLSVVPLAIIEEKLLVALADPASMLALDDIALMTRMEIVPALAARKDVVQAIDQLDRLDEAVQDAADAHEEPDEDDPLEGSPAGGDTDDQPTIKLVNAILAQAVRLRASDIHMTPSGGDVKVQFRVDGVLGNETTVPRPLRRGIVSRIKVMAEMDIAERRLPQDGRLAVKVDGRKIDVRVVTLPLSGGEGVVMRILDKSAGSIHLDVLGMAAHDRERFEYDFRRPYGLVVVCGPTGSGKTTTLYAALNALNSRERSIITIEDPVEYQLDGIRQLQVHAKAGLTFAAGLRSILRADPDVVMVGEIRDRETAQIAVEAALTGHLVLSTLHTNDAPTAINRLVDMGVEPFLVASAMRCAVAQRLARCLCVHCKRPMSGEDIAADPVLADLADGAELFEPVGCSRCSGTGYHGRIGLYEVMQVEEEIRRLTLKREPADAISAVARPNGMRLLREDGIDKVRAGITSAAELLRVTSA